MSRLNAFIASQVMQLCVITIILLIGFGIQYLHSIDDRAPVYVVSFVAYCLVSYVGYLTMRQKK